MVRAILDGRKTQTRRIVKPQPPDSIDELHGTELRKRAPYALLDDDGNYCGRGFQDENTHYKCPYGKIGERLWVRETCWSDGHYVYYPANFGHKSFGSSDESYERLLRLHHYAGGMCEKVPSIHMPRWACRIILEIEKIRVERLHEITDADCVAEGLEPIGEKLNPPGGSVQIGRLNEKYAPIRQLFSELWTEINGPNSWNDNPWVWVIEFRKLED